MRLMISIIVTILLLAVISCGGSSFGTSSTVGPYKHPDQAWDVKERAREEGHKLYTNEEYDILNPDRETVIEYCSNCHIIY